MLDEEEGGINDGAMAEMMEILTLHSVGERDGQAFSPLALPYSVFIALADSLKGFVVGGKGTKEERDEILDTMVISQREGSWTLGVVVAATLLSSAPIQSLRADLTAISQHRFDAISDSSRAKALRNLQHGMRENGLTHLGVKSDILEIAETNILPEEGEAEVEPEVWVQAQRYFPANPKLNVQLELEGGKTVKADAGVNGFDAIGANVPAGHVQVLLDFQYNPATGERRNERILKVVRHSADFDEKAFDEMASRPNGWSSVADPVAEIRRMRDGVV